MLPNELASPYCYLMLIHCYPCCSCSSVLPHELASPYCYPCLFTATYAYLLLPVFICAHFPTTADTYICSFLHYYPCLSTAIHIFVYFHISWLSPTAIHTYSLLSMLTYCCICAHVCALIPTAVHVHSHMHAFIPHCCPCLSIYVSMIT